MGKELGQRRRWPIGRRRPSRAEVDPAALELLQRHGSQILQTARRYSATPEDAEDAYQRAFEILLTKAPTTSEDDLVPWLRTVVKHEALAIRRQRDRATPTSDDEGLLDPPGSAPPAHESAERYERLRLGAEALRRLKPQEIRCLVLRAQGYTYDQISAETGWTYTKVNRCLTEGRRSFLAQVRGIESGAECERLRPLLSLLADGEAKAEDLAALRPHLKGCLSCRAQLKAYRSVPPRVAALVPAAALAGADGPFGRSQTFVESLVGALHDRVAALGHRAGVATEMASAQKAAAVAASAAALAGGGAAAVSELDADGSSAATPPRERPARAERAGEVAPRPAPPSIQPAPQAAPTPAPAPPPASAPPSPSPSQPSAPPPEPEQAEFSPGAGGGSPPPAGGAGPPGGSGAPDPPPSGGGSAEFGP